MNKVYSKLILTDVDGVLLDWYYSFFMWMKRHGYNITNEEFFNLKTECGLEGDDMLKFIKIFNESSTIYNIPPLYDAVKYVKKLHEEHGFVFHAITSLSNEYSAQYLRTKNLKNLFGETVFEKFVYLDTGVTKEEVLKQYKDMGCVWVEDIYKNAEAGIKYGLDSLLMNQSYNADYDGFAKRVYNWKEIYEYLTNK